MIAGNFQSADLSAALSWASSAVEAYCERRFTQVLGDVVRLDPNAFGSAMLTNPPVTNVTLVEGFLPSPVSGGYVWTTLTNYDFTPDGFIWDTTAELGLPYCLPTWPILPRSLRVTYDHGYVTTGGSANLPQPIVDAVIKAAAGYLSNPYNLVERKAGDAMYRWSDREKSALLDESLLGDYRLVSV